MSASSTRMTKARKVSIAGIAAAGVAAITLTLVPAGGSTAAEAAPASPASAAPAAWTLNADTAKTAALHTGENAQKSTIELQVEQAVKSAAKAEADAKAQAEAAVKNTAAKKAAAEAAAKEAATKARAKEQAASRTVAVADRTPVYADNLDGWIREALDIMKKHGIPGTYDGLHRNIMRESSGNPRAINNWDINAINGVPSKGLLQVIQPTFDAYHVKGTKYDLYDPVANIVAACNYAADRYGSMDNVNSAY
ncbi:transglycosylase SLT domain-containing protein [Streptomyces sp. NPDC051018]|uniref:transglycosylase SLT domain-containing protein n=1 Tax=Streptomyces sp. NPDC051018 TaxID=3365639 RepID=UPI0037B6FA45